MIICRTILNNYRNFFWCLIFQITNIMSSSSIFSSIMTMTSDFMIIFFIIVSTKSFFAYITNFSFFFKLVASFFFFHNWLFLLHQMNIVQTMNSQKVYVHLFWLLMIFQDYCDKSSFFPSMILSRGINNKKNFIDLSP